MTDVTNRPDSLKAELQREVNSEPPVDWVGRCICACCFLIAAGVGSVELGLDRVARMFQPQKNGASRTGNVNAGRKSVTLINANFHE